MRAVWSVSRVQTIGRGPELGFAVVERGVGLRSARVGTRGGGPEGACMYAGTGWPELDADPT